MSKYSVLTTDIFCYQGTWVTWRRISAFVAVPAILLCAWNAWEKEKEHATHGREEFVAYSHLRTRAKVCFEFHYFLSFAILLLIIIPWAKRY